MHTTILASTTTLVVVILLASIINPSEYVCIVCNANRLSVVRYSEETSHYLVTTLVVVKSCVILFNYSSINVECRP